MSVVALLDSKPNPGNCVLLLLFVGLFQLWGRSRLSLPPQQLSLLSACVAPGSEE